MDYSSSGFFLNITEGSGMENGTDPIPEFLYYTGFCRKAELSDTNITFPFLWEILPALQKYAPYVTAVQAVFFIISFFWNLFILISFGMRRKLLKETASVYLFNLALTDLLLAVFVVFQCFLTEAAGAFIVGTTDVIRCGICEFLGFMIMLLMAVTIHTLAMLSFDRFFLLVKPLSYHQYFNWRRALVIVIIIWVFSFGLAIPPIFGFGEYSFSVAIANCHPQWVGISYQGIDNFNYIILVAGEAILPIFMLTFTNMWTYKVIMSVLRKKLKRQRSFNSGPATASGPELKTSESKHNRQQIQLVKVFGALFIAHVMCWTPVLIVVAVGIGIGALNVPPEVFLVAWMFYLTNPVAHPILETFFVKDLRLRVYRAHKSVRNSLRRMSSMGNSFKRSWSQRSESKSSESKRSTLDSKRSTFPSKKQPISCHNGLALDRRSSASSEGGASLPECDHTPLKSRDVKFSVSEVADKGRKAPMIPEAIIEDPDSIDCVDGHFINSQRPNGTGLANTSVENGVVFHQGDGRRGDLHRVGNGVTADSKIFTMTV